MHKTFLSERAATPAARCRRLPRTGRARAIVRGRDITAPPFKAVFWGYTPQNGAGRISNRAGRFAVLKAI